jgi:hypothetical protein
MLAPARRANWVLGSTPQRATPAPPCSFAKYTGGYSETSSTVQMLWKVVDDLPPADRAALLK